MFQKELDFWSLPPDYNQTILLEELFDSKPRKISAEAKKRWLKLGPFDLKTCIQNK